MRTTILCLLAFALSPSMTPAQASAGVPVIKIVKEESSIKFNVKASVALEGTFDKWDATVTSKKSLLFSLPSFIPLPVFTLAA